MKYAFEVRRVDGIVARVSSKNPSSRSLHLKLGFQLSGKIETEPLL